MVDIDSGIKEFLELVNYVHHDDPNYPRSEEFDALADVLFSEILRNFVEIDIVRRLIADFFKRR
jgi:hypothetical protein